MPGPKKRSQIGNNSEIARLPYRYCTHYKDYDNHDEDDDFEYPNTEKNSNSDE